MFNLDLPIRELVLIPIEQNVSFKALRQASLLHISMALASRPFPSRMTFASKNSSLVLNSDTGW